MCGRHMFDEAADDLDPAPNVRDIAADRFGPKMAGEGAFTMGSRRPMGKHCCCRRQGLPKDGLDVVG
jgi:hypothetical protein